MPTDSTETQPVSLAGGLGARPFHRLHPFVQVHLGRWRTVSRWHGRPCHATV